MAHTRSYQNDGCTQRKRRQVNMNVAQNFIHHCIPPFTVSRASNGNITSLEKRLVKHPPRAPFSRFGKMISDYLKAPCSCPLWWILLLVVLAWGLNVRRARRKISKAARTRRYDNSMQKRKEEGKGIRKYNMAMGIRKLNQEDWLRMDENFSLEHKIRSELLIKQKDKVLQCLPGSDEACFEALEGVVKYLTEKFPDTFHQSSSWSGCDRVHVVETGETFHIKPPFNNLQPLEIAARLTMEDLNILSQDWHSGEHHL